MSRCLTGPEIVKAAKFLELHREKICGLNRLEIAAELGKHLGRLVTVANADTALDASGIADEWRASQARRKSLATRAAAMNRSYSHGERITALEDAVRRLRETFGVKSEDYLPNKDGAS